VGGHWHHEAGGRGQYHATLRAASRCVAEIGMARTASSGRLSRRLGAVGGVETVSVEHLRVAARRPYRPGRRRRALEWVCPVQSMLGAAAPRGERPADQPLLAPRNRSHGIALGFHPVKTTPPGQKPDTADMVVNQSPPPDEYGFAGLPPSMMSACRASGASDNQIQAVMRALVAITWAELQAGRSISWPNLGTWRPITKQARPGRNVHTGGAITIPATSTYTWRQNWRRSWV
jgi:nucleoid DNA-binding protein